MIDWSFAKQTFERIAVAEERQAKALELIAGVVDEVYREERIKTVPASEVTPIHPFVPPTIPPAAPRVPRARATV